MISFLAEADRSLFLFLNGMNSPFWDFIMFQATKPEVWTPVFLFLLYLTIRHYRWQTVMIVVAVSLMITMSDQLATFFKEMVQRLRPSHEPGLQVHLVNLYKGGMFGFYSSHASNFFSLAMFLSILLYRYHRWLVIPLMIWAGFISYTRIYLGVHYPGDILTGMTIGLCLGYFFGSITLQACLNTREWFSRMK